MTNSMDKTASRVREERLAVFLRNALKPEEISGPDADARIEELLGWFKRYFEGNANPKWSVAHAAELAYALQSLRSLSDSVSDGSKGVVETVALKAARDLIDTWCIKHATGMPPVTARDKLVTDILSLAPADEMLPNGTRLHEPTVPQYVLEAFREKYRKHFDLSAFDGSWGNTDRFKHSHIQSLWEGWRDGYLALSALDSGKSGQQDVSGEQVMNVAGRIQSILSQKLTVEEREIIGVGPASYKIARLFKPAPTEPKAGVVSEARDKLLAEVISLIEDDMYGPGETGEVEERIAFNKALRRQINRITSRMIARAALPNTTGETE